MSATSASRSPRAAKNSNVPTRRWLAATRVRIAPGSISSRMTRSPVVATASARVVGMPSAAIASLTRYSRSTGPSAARPSPPRENGVRSGALELDVAPLSVLADDLAQQDGATVAELRDEAAELVAGVGERERLRAGRDLVADQQRGAGTGGELLRAGAEQLCQRLVDPHDARVADLRGRDASVEAVRQTRVAVVEGEHGAAETLT